MDLANGRAGVRRTNLEPRESQRVPDVLDITCPRCQQAAAVRFYGPCDACRDELRATLGGVGHTLEQVEYEPKMNVTPNAVASRE